MIACNIGIGRKFRTAILVATSVAALCAQNATTLTGTVKDGATQAGIGGAIVTMLSNPMVTATTTADGSFSLMLSEPVGIGKDGRGANAITATGTDLSFTVGPMGAALSVDLHDLRGNHLKSIHNGRLQAGEYALSAVPAGVPAGLYLVRARLDGLTRTLKVSTAGGAPAQAGIRAMPASAPRLARKSAAAAEFLVVTKEGYLKKHHAIAAMDQAQNVTLDANKPAAGNLKIFSDKEFPTIDWANAVIYSWEQTATLFTDSSRIGFDSSVSAIKVSTAEGFTWNGWAFHVASQDNGTQPTADLTPYKGGSLHLAIKGDVPTLGVLMSSYNQPKSSAPLVDLAAKGYLPDGQWHEITIPLSDFDDGALNLAEIFVYCGFVAPNAMGGTFDPAATYLVDDIYFMPAK